jgi:hypothetical protein
MLEAKSGVASVGEHDSSQVYIFLYLLNGRIGPAPKET